MDFTPTKTSFVVDFTRTGEDQDFAMVDAYGVEVTETGDLIFFNEQGVPFDMWASGYWLRCKIRSAE